MFCPNCGKEVQEGAEFCSSCGTNVKEGKAVSHDFAGKIKTASQDAISAFKIFIVNPVGGLSTSFESLDKSRALWAGIFFALIFDVLMLLGTYLGMKKIKGGIGSLLGLYPLFDGIKFADILKLLIGGTIPFVSLAISSIVARKIFHGRGNFEGDIFIAGSALLPLGFFAFLTGLLGVANFEVVAILFVFAICYTILILYSGCTKISKISEWGSALAVPIMLLLSAWFSKIIFSALW